MIDIVQSFLLTKRLLCVALSYLRPDISDALPVPGLIVVTEYSSADPQLFQ